MSDFDLVIRGGKAATAVDVFRTDIGVRDGRIVALANDLPKGRREIDASNHLVLPAESTHIVISISQPGTSRSWPTILQAVPARRPAEAQRR